MIVKSKSGWLRRVPTVINRSTKLNFSQYQGEKILKMKKINLYLLRSEKGVIPTEMIIKTNSLIKLEGIMNSIINDKEAIAGEILKEALMEMAKSLKMKTHYGALKKEDHLILMTSKIFMRI